MDRATKFVAFVLVAWSWVAVYGLGRDRPNDAAVCRELNGLLAVGFTMYDEDGELVECWGE